jgi:hypothetical protein
MTPRYATGRRIPPNVIDALAFTGKVGFLSREIWETFFGVGTLRWKEIQLLSLVSGGYLKRHRDKIAKGFYVTTTRTDKLLAKLKLPRVSPVPTTYLSHDELVATSLLKLRSENFIQGYLVEKELKTYGIKDFLLSEVDHKLNYPDAITNIFAFNEDLTVAIEYEKERKALSRYKSTLYQYAKLPDVSMVLFICQNPGIESAIKSAMKHLGQTELSDRLAFVDAEEWLASPADARVYIDSGPIKLRENCKKF